MTLKEAIKKAVEEHNTVMAGKIADALRFRYGMNHESIRQMFSTLSERSDLCTPPKFDALMREADEGY